MGIEALINVDVLRKRIDSLDITIDVLARKVGVKPEKIKMWLLGKQKPTYKQAKKLAWALRIPFAYLITDLPPQMDLPLPDLRTKPDALQLSENARAVIFDAYRKVEWLRERRAREGRNVLDFVGYYNLNDDPDKVAKDIIETTGIPNSWEIRTPDDFLRESVKNTEDIGIIVLRSSVVANNNYRKLKAEEFRGFAIADKIAPLVFINADDELNAQIFTLFHELAHIWLGESGVSDIIETERSKIENFCNEVAAEVLMPKEVFLNVWNKEEIESISMYFKASIYAVLVRALRLKLLTKDEFDELYIQFYAGYKKRRKGAGGDFYNTFLARQSRSFTLEVLSAVGSGDILYKDAAGLLNTNIGVIDKLLRRFKFVREPRA